LIPSQQAAADAASKAIGAMINSGVEAAGGAGPEARYNLDERQSPDWVDGV